MTFTEAYIQLKAYARIDGALLGLFWVLSFACFVGQFQYPLCGMLWMASLVLTPFFVAYRTSRFRNVALGGYISFRRAFAHAAWTFFYAALILAIAQWAYFQYMDHGRVVDQLSLLFADKDLQQMLTSMNYPIDQINQAIDAWRTMRPIDFALQTLWTNCLVSLLLSLPIAAVMKRKKIQPIQ